MCIVDTLACPQFAAFQIWEFESSKNSSFLARELTSNQECIETQASAEPAARSTWYGWKVRQFTEPIFWAMKLGWWYLMVPSCSPSKLKTLIDQESPFICNPDLAANVPVIDMSKLLSADFMDSELHKFHHACKEWGFFQVSVYI